MLNIGLRRLAGLGAVALLVVAGVAFVACSGSDDDASVADTAADAAAHVEGDTPSDEAAHVEGDTHDDAVADGAAHDDAVADGHDGSADMGGMDMGGNEVNAYLEAAPKDALYLVQMTNFAFTPSVLEVNSGEVLEIAIQNVEPLLHDFTIEKIDADVHISYLEGSGQHAHAAQEADAADVHFPLSEPGAGVVHLKIHEPGEYVFYCTVPGHREAGMEGTLIVQ